MITDRKAAAPRTRRLSRFGAWTSYSVTTPPRPEVSASLKRYARKTAHRPRSAGEERVAARRQACRECEAELRGRPHAPSTRLVRRRGPERRCESILSRMHSPPRRCRRARTAAHRSQAESPRATPPLRSDHPPSLRFRRAGCRRALPAQAQTESSASGREKPLVEVVVSTGGLAGLLPFPLARIAPTAMTPPSTTAPIVIQAMRLTPVACRKATIPQARAGVRRRSRPASPSTLVRRRRASA